MNTQNKFKVWPFANLTERLAKAILNSANMYKKQEAKSPREFQHDNRKKSKQKQAKEIIRI